MYDDAPFLILSSISSLVMLAVFSALIWAAVMDGRDELAFRNR